MCISQGSIKDAAPPWLSLGITEEGTEIVAGPYTIVGRTGEVRIWEQELEDQRKATNQPFGGTSWSLRENQEARQFQLLAWGPQRSGSEGCCPSDRGPGAAIGQLTWQLEGKTDRGGGSSEKKLESAGRISASIADCFLPQLPSKNKGCCFTPTLKTPSKFLFWSTLVQDHEKKGESKNTIPVLPSWHHTKPPEMWPWASYLISLSLSFLTCTMAIISVPTSWGGW